MTFRIEFPNMAHFAVYWTISHNLVTTSGAPILFPVGNGHSKLKVGQRFLIRYSDSGVSPSSSRILALFRTFRVQNGD